MSWLATPSSTTVVAAGDLVLDLAEDLADLVFDRVGAAGLRGEAMQIREELLVDEIAQVVAGRGPVVVEFAVLALGRRPVLPTIGFVEDEGEFPADQGGFIGQVLLEAVEVFEEEQPGRLLGVVELGRATCLFPEDVVDVFEGLFEHGVVVLLVSALNTKGARFDLVSQQRTDFIDNRKLSTPGVSRKSSNFDRKLRYQISKSKHNGFIHFRQLARSAFTGSSGTEIA